MPRPAGRSRPFTAIDGLILAIGVAAGGAAGWWVDGQFLRVLNGYRGVNPHYPWMPRWLVEAELPFKRAQMGAIAALVPISVAAALAAFRRRVGGRRLAFASPGLAALATVAGAIVVRVGIELLQYGKMPAGRWPPVFYWTNLMESFKLEETAPLAAAWAYLAIGRLWHPRNDWRDWLGRWIGGTWLGLIGLDLAFVALWR